MGHNGRQCIVPPAHPAPPLVVIGACLPPFCNPPPPPKHWVFHRIDATTRTQYQVGSGWSDGGGSTPDQLQPPTGFCNPRTRLSPTWCGPMGPAITAARGRECPLTRMHASPGRAQSAPPPPQGHRIAQSHDGHSRVQWSAEVHKFSSDRPCALWPLPKGCPSGLRWSLSPLPLRTA